MKQSIFTDEARAEISLFVRAFRVKYRLSRLELAGRCELSEPTIRNVEIGQHVSDDTLAKIAAVVMPKPNKKE